MNTHDHQQHALVLGLGVSGLSMARWCAHRGMRVTVADTREQPPGLDALRAECPEARFVTASLDAALLDQDAFTLICRSPGLTPAELIGLAAAAGERGLPVVGELDLFSEALSHLEAERDYRPAVLAVTGTNGKTTVTALTAALIERAGKSVVAAGNIGAALLDSLRQCLDEEALPEVWVLELSSFQLADLADAHSFAPTAAAILNISQDHLDWHGSMAAYVAAKARVLGPGTMAVLNRDDPAVMALAPASPAPFGRRRKAAEPRPITFGASAPQRPGDYGLETEGGICWLAHALPEAAGTRADTETLHLRRLMPADVLRIHGRHNALNALAALALATRCGCTLAPMLHGLREYRGEPHRTESIGLLDEVEYFDDSKGTNVGATVAALRGLGATRSLVIILGGDGKGQDFSPLAEPVARHARAVVLIGRDAPLIRQSLDGTGVALLNAATLEEAVSIARKHARAGDAVLLSPACASWDMFPSYLHRAQAYREAVGELARASGTELGVPA